MHELFLNLGLYILDLAADPFYLVVVFIVGLQYYRVFSLHKKFHGTYRIRWGYVFGAILVGLFAGYLGSILLVFIGISIDLTGPTYLWVVALILFLFHQRLLCFAYSGGLICLAKLLTGHPNIDVPQVLGLVAVLHLVESCLIWISGHWDPLPVYCKNAEGQLIGAFVLQKFWPLPLVALANVYFTSAGGGIMVMPQWWPLLLPKQFAGVVLALTALPAALGYGDIAVSATPRQRARKSALALASYSLLLLLLSYLSVSVNAIAYLAAVFAPLGHELVIRWGKRQEWQGQPLYACEKRGVKILDVLPDSPADQAGICRGDIVLEINEAKVFNRQQLVEEVAKATHTLCCTFLALDKQQVLTCRMPVRDKLLGIITVPEEQDRAYVELDGTGFLLRGLKKLTN